MRGILSGIAFLSLFAGSRRAAADEGVEQTKAKLQAVQKQLEELGQQEQALLRQLAAQEPTKRSDGYIKAEVKGVLRHEGVYFPPPFSNPDGQVVKSWTITVEDTKWVLHFGDNRAFLDLAKANEGKTVVVTGTVGTRVLFRPPALNTFKSDPPPPPPTGLSVATFKAAAK
jgi:16S rRNA G966 N2-methylase RsmD